MKPSVVVVGSLNKDLVIHVEQFPREGETLLGTGLLETTGGKGANQAVALGKLRTPVSMIGKVGSDSNASKLIDSLQQAAVDTGNLLLSESSTGMAIVTVNKAGSNHVVVIPGANYELTADDIEKHRKAIEQCEIVVLQLEIPVATVQYTLRLAKELGKITVLNPAPAQMLTDEILRHVDFLIPNEHELFSISGIRVTDKASLQEAAHSILNRGVQALVITLGEKGCCYANRDIVKFYPARTVEAKDTTAAGDSFIAGFVAGYLKHRDVDSAIEYAQIAASITVTRHGAQCSLPTFEEVEQLSCSVDS
ncbi:MULTISPECIES: ribokinase [unclassified Paenibacillus]|uniref:ribokinase n=1 Tax=unclassified Paenibacillus TaxID=185978 RepID=UPI003635DB4E